ncbi:Target SNARE coiled-coil homology domain [Dillenia turbinata]|uniref:Target SNARE coiled-coil homology domain n=1 Tax=Dillenia turbinata TaxID=194707 RepID=A0AAN8Z8E3_9MAGN
MSFEDLESGRPMVARTKEEPSQVVASGVFRINTAVSSFQRLVNTLGTPRDTLELREKLHKTRLHIGQLVKDTSAKLREASEIDQHSEVSVSAFPFGSVTELQPSKRIADAKLAKDFQFILKEFQKAQRLAAEREAAYAPFIPKDIFPPSDTGSELQESRARSPDRQVLLESRSFQGVDSPDIQLGIPKTKAVLFELRSVVIYRHLEYKCFVILQLNFNRGTTSFNCRQEVVALENEIVYSEAIIEEREQGIQEIQVQIGEVNEMFNDLAVLVHDQGVVIDDISSNVERSHAATVEAKSQLLKASKTQKSNSSLFEHDEIAFK